MSLWQVVYFDKRFKGVEKHKQSKVLKYKHISSEELNSIKKDNNGKVRLLSTGKLDGFCNIELDDNRVNFGKVITIPTGGSAIIKYHSGYFIDSLNILMESQDNNLYDSKYIYYCLLEQSDLIQQYFKGSSIQHPDMKKIVEISLLIPNIEIQRNIVRTIEVLEPLIAIYSELFSELELLRNELPKKLENSIINYAMEGKLVKQDQNNDSVDNLINEIYKEKQKLVEQGKLKKADLNNLIIYKNDNDNSYYENQSTKPYIKLGNIAELYTGDSINKTFKKKFLSAFSELSYISTKDVGFDKEISYDNGVWIPENFKNEYKIAPKNSILLCIEGGSAGRKMAITKRDVAFGNKLCCINSNNLSNKFLSYFFQCDTFKNMFNSKTKGIISGISLSNLKSIEIPIFSGTYQEKLINKLNLIGTIIKKLC
ncbi:Type I restriction modification system specificity (S) subunit, HsdS [Mycoplasmopsis bovis 1067]|nr:restriction endonuclease subunit S [Mycoplasmopsis bovis]TKA60625.1 Type I restriction modification system specificity (S) subunit, HsdS [Mycoplasmopsis bovis 1067]